jgi:signal transduction histidine kinase/ligand-binding sensor domain-containing protein
MVNSRNFFLCVKRWTLAVLILIPGKIAFAQENIRFERISVIDGLSQSDVRCMVQDNFGFLWIGTRDGLNRYDGLDFHKYRREVDDSTSLQFNQIWTLETDSSGNIWVGSAGGISIYDYQKDHFQNFIPAESELRDIDINDILLLDKHTAILSTNKGLVNFDLNQRRFFVDSDLVLFKGMKVLHSNWTSTNGLWVATDRGVFIKADGQSRWERLLENSSVQRIDFDPNGKVYLCTSSGLFSYDVKIKKLEQIVATPVTEVLRLQNGDLWVASYKIIVLNTNDAVKYVLEHDKFNHYSLSEDRARVLYQTRDEVIWVGTFGYGLNKFDPDIAKFSYLSEQTSVPLSGNYVSTIFTTDDSTMLVGTSRGMDVIDLRKRSAKHFSNDRDLFQILKIIMDRDNSIWVSTSAGFMQYSKGELINKNNALRSVYSFAEWDDTHLILATRLSGIYLFDKKTDKTTLFISNEDLPEEVSCLLVEHDHVWVGCKDGLKRFDRKGHLIDHFKANNDKPRSLLSSFVKVVFRDSKGNLWVGTWGGGLSLLNARDGTFSTFTIQNGLPNEVVYGILEDQAGIFWLSTNHGLSAFDPNGTVLRNFDFFDGLQSDEFNTGAYFASPGGRMYFGGVNGLTYFDPNEVLEPLEAAVVLKTSVTVNSKSLTFRDTDNVKNVVFVDKITSGWKENDVGLKFTAIDFRQPHKNNFQYSIRDTTWYDIGNRRSLELIDLSSGQYELKIRTRRQGSSWSSGAVLLTINIIPPVWQRGWFQIASAIIFLGLIFSLYRYRVTRLKMANALLNKMVDERTQEIQAMNEEIASQNDQLQEMVKELEAFSYSVSHDLRAPLRSVIGYLKILEEDLGENLNKVPRQTLGIIERNALKMNNLIDDLLEFSKLTRQELRKSEIDTEKLVRELLAEIDTTASHKAKIILNTLPQIRADSKLIEQVWVNLISNAIKYSAKKENPVIEIGSYQENGRVVFYVKDNGVGFNMKYADKLFGVFQRLHKAEDFAGTGVGLALVQRIVNKHGGSVWAEAKINEGATFYFSLPEQGSNGQG